MTPDPMLTRPSVLYISYDGMLEPLGQSQVIAYLERLSGDYRIHLVSFEKAKDRANVARVAAIRARLATADIAWTPLPYHKTPTAPATAYDIAAGTFVALWIALRHRVRIIHARSYVPALMAVAVKRLTGLKFLFDMRGFWADERVDGGLWPPDGRLYRISKRLERSFLLSADHVVTLTKASAAEIARFPYLAGRMPPISIISTCADLERFSPSPGETPGDSPRPFTFGYVGSIGTWYLFDEVLECFKLIVERAPDARLLIVNRGEHDVALASAARIGIDPSRIEIVAAEHRDVPDHIRRMSAGAAIIKPVYSKMASAPTKLAEYLGCGVPCLGNTNVGDMEEILDGERIGATLTDFSPEDRAAAVDRLLALTRDPGTPARCVDAARRLFSLEGGVDSYRSIYRGLTGPGT